MPGVETGSMQMHTFGLAPVHGGAEAVVHSMPMLFNTAWDGLDGVNVGTFETVAHGVVGHHNAMAVWDGLDGFNADTQPAWSEAAFEEFMTQQYGEVPMDIYN